MLRLHSTSTPFAPQWDVLQQLSCEIQQLETAGRRGRDKPASSAGCPALDAILPRSGYEAGSVVEYLRTTPACGATTLALAAAAAAMQTSGGFLVVVDSGHSIYPPTVASHGIDLAKVIFVRPQSQADSIWAVDQALRSLAVAAVVAELERIDDRTARRLQLAAEQGEGLALLLRSAAVRKQPSWAEVQWLCRPRQGLAASLVGSPRAFEVQLARVRGGKPGGTVCLEIDSVTGKLQPVRQTAANKHERNSHEQAGTASKSAVHLASQLAHPKSRSRRASAG